METRGTTEGDWGDVPRVVVRSGQGNQFVICKNKKRALLTQLSYVFRLVYHPNPHGLLSEGWMSMCKLDYRMVIALDEPVEA